LTGRLFHDFNILYNNNNNIYFAKGLVHQQGKSPSKLATILRATKEKKRKTTLQTFRQTCQYSE